MGNASEEETVSRSRKFAVGWTVALIVAALGLTLLLSTASAHKRSFETTVQLKTTAVTDTVLQFEGRVVSDRAKCKRYRSVFVDAFDTRIAEATSLINGDWLVQAGPRPPKGTTLIAFSPRKFLKRSKKHKHKCESDFAEKKAP